MSNPAPASPGASPKSSPTAVRKPLPWRVPSSRKDVAATPSSNPNYRPPAPGK